MTQIPASKADLVRADNVQFKAGGALPLALLAGGVLCALIALAAAFLKIGVSDLGAKQALAAYHVGFIVVTGMSLGALVFTMVLHQTNAGWAGSIRRQFENIMGMMPICFLLSLPVLLSVFVMPGKLWKWMDAAYVAGDPIYDAKAAFLNVPFFTVRWFVYFAIWTILAVKLYGYSRAQDISGDRWLTAKARKMSSYGLLLFAFSAAFASFDWMMSLDFHWFSTMFGVYFFAGNVGAALAATVLIIFLLRSRGKLDGLFNAEHLHDMGKLLFAFTVFWAYIGFSQYFLIWYANIPEETFFFIRRRDGGWMTVSMALATLRFIVPFLILMPRPFRRTPAIVGAMAALMLGCHVLDMFWLVRPQIVNEAYVPVTFGFLDVVGIAGPVLIFAGLLARRIVNTPLIPVNDPRLDETISHKNYI